MSAINFYSRSAPPNRPLWRFHIRQSHNEALQLAFSYLTYSQLRRCMLVSKFWRKSALEELQARCSARISDEEHIKHVLQKLKACSKFRVGSLSIHSIPVDNSIPFLKQIFCRVNITLNFLRLESRYEIREAILSDILHQLPNLTHLSITSLELYHRHYDTDNNSDEERKYGFSFLGHNNEPYKNLNNSMEEENGNAVVVHHSIRHLHLDLGPHTTFQLTKIFQTFPNLFELAIANVREEPLKHFKSSSSSSAAAYPIRQLTLRQYSNITFSEKLVQTLMRLNMQLENLVLIFHPPTQSSTKRLQTSSPLLRQFVESLSKRLESLKLVQVEDDLSRYSSWHTKSSTMAMNYEERNLLDQEKLSNSLPVIPPTTPTTGCSSALVNYSWSFNYSSTPISILPMALLSLRELHVQKPLITNLAQVLNNFPFLKALSVQVSYGSNWKGMLPAKLEPHENIIKLKIDFIDAESFARLGHWFPYLKYLQLSYCDISLFNVLSRFIPSFNKGDATSRMTKENIFSCQYCHSFMAGNGEDAFDDGIEKNGVVSIDDGNEGCFMKGAGVSDANFNGQSLTTIDDSKLGREETGEKLLQLPRKRFVFKHLTHLRLRSCVHLPFENFVFLQRDREHHQGTNKQISSSVFLADHDLTCFDEAVENDLERTQEAFSWEMIGALKKEKFAEFLPTTSSDDNETCSSA